MKLDELKSQLDKESHNCDQENHNTISDRPKHNKRSPIRYSLENFASYYLLISNGDPSTFHAAMDCFEGTRGCKLQWRRWNLE